MRETVESRRVPRERCLRSFAPVTTCEVNCVGAKASHFHVGITRESHSYVGILGSIYQTGIGDRHWRQALMTPRSFMASHKGAFDWVRPCSSRHVKPQCPKNETTSTNQLCPTAFLPYLLPTYCQLAKKDSYGLGFVYGGDRRFACPSADIFDKTAKQQGNATLSGLAGFQAAT